MKDSDKIEIIRNICYGFGLRVRTTHYAPTILILDKYGGVLMRIDINRYKATFINNIGVEHRLLAPDSKKDLENSIHDLLTLFCDKEVNYAIWR